MRIVASVCMGSTPVLNYYVTFFLCKKPPVSGGFFISGILLVFSPMIRYNGEHILKPKEAMPWTG